METSLDCILKKLDISKIFINTSIVILCIAILFSSQSFIKDHSSPLYIIFILGSITGILIFGYKAIFANKMDVYKSTGSKIKNVSLSFCSANNNIDSLIKLFDSCNLDDIKKLNIDNNGNVIFVDILYSEDGCFGAYQVRHYVPYQYEIYKGWSLVNHYSMKHLVEGVIGKN